MQKPKEQQRCSHFQIPFHFLRCIFNSKRERDLLVRSPLEKIDHPKPPGTWIAKLPKGIMFNRPKVLQWSHLMLALSPNTIIQLVHFKLSGEEGDRSIPLADNLPVIGRHLLPHSSVHLQWKLFLYSRSSQCLSTFSNTFWHLSKGAPDILSRGFYQICQGRYNWREILFQNGW